MYTKELIKVFNAEIKTHLFRWTVENVDVILNAMTLPTRHNSPITNIYSGTDNVVSDNRLKNGCAVANNTETNTTGCIFGSKFTGNIGHTGPGSIVWQTIQNPDKRPQHGSFRRRSLPLQANTSLLRRLPRQNTLPPGRTQHTSTQI